MRGAEGRPAQPVFHQFGETSGSGQNFNDRSHLDPRSNTRIAETANRFSISGSRLEEPIVREYLAAHNASTDVHVAIMKGLGELRQDTKLTLGVRELLQANYNSSLGFITTINLKIEEQLGVRTLAPGDIKESLEPAIADMGLSIAYGSDTFSGDYHTRMFAHDAVYFEARKERRARALQQDPNLDYVLLSKKRDGTYTTYPAAVNYPNYSSTQRYAHILNQFSKTGINLRAMEEIYPPKEPDKEDYSDEVKQGGFINELHLLMYETLSEWIIYNKAKHPSSFRSTLNAFLEPYDLRVDVTPSNLSVLVQDHEVSPAVQERLRRLRDQQ